MFAGRSAELNPIKLLGEDLIAGKNILPLRPDDSNFLVGSNLPFLLEKDGS